MRRAIITWFFWVPGGAVAAWCGGRCPRGRARGPRPTFFLDRDQFDQPRRRKEASRMGTTEQTVTAVRDSLAPVVAGLGLALYDVELHGTGKARTLRVT